MPNEESSYMSLRSYCYCNNYFVSYLSTHYNSYFINSSWFFLINEWLDLFILFLSVDNLWILYLLNSNCILVFNICLHFCPIFLGNCYFSFYMNLSIIKNNNSSLQYSVSLFYVVFYKNGFKHTNTSSYILIDSF